MAEVGAGLLTSGIVKIAHDKLCSAIEEQADLALNFSDDLEYMKKILESMAVVFKDAEKQSVKDESVRLWIKRLKYAALDISDMIDDYQDNDIRSTAKMPRMLSCFTTAHNKMVLANKVKSVRDKLKKINEERLNVNCSFMIPGSHNQQLYDQRETTSAVDEVLGRDAEKKQLMDILSATHKKNGTTVLPIYGLGGMGKSTLAQLVFNDTQFKQYDHRIWVYVSEVFDLKKIGRTIISQLSTDGGHQNTNTLELIQECLDKLLHGKKILIILDDIWQEDASELDKLKCMLHVNKKGSMVDVLVTTRSESIAKKFGTNGAYKLQPLTDKVCWDIMKRYSGFEDKKNKQKLEQIGLDIAKKCGGAALAAQALGYMLRSKDLSGWLEIRNNDIWNNDIWSEDHGRYVPMKLSYEFMPPELRLCFSYCAIFPKRHDIYEDDLVHQWLALDFIKKPSEGKEYISQLLGMSFLQHSKLSTVSGKNAMWYNMNDLVHDLARSVVSDELIVIDAGGMVKKCEQTYYQYALLINYDGQTKSSDILPKKIKALHFSSSSKLGPHDALFSVMKGLRVLDLSACTDLLLPSSIDQLRQLKCLIAPELQNKSLPEGTSELPKLQYLNLRESSLISGLPESIGKLCYLIYLGMSGCSGIIKVPESFGGLKSLVHLDMSNCGGIKDLPDSIGNLSKLQHLDISRCSGIKEIPESLDGLHQLQYLNLSYCNSITRLPEAIGRLNNLQYLDLQSSKRITELPGSFQELKNLVHLDLSHCTCAEGLPEALCGLTSLEYLNMGYLDINPSFQIDVSRATGNLTNLKYLDVSGMGYHADSIGTLTNLVHLILRQNQNIVSLPDSIGNLRRLHTLDLSYCYGLESIPDSICNIRALKVLLIEGCRNEVIELVNSKLHFLLTLPLFMVKADVNNACSNLHLLHDINVVKLRICFLENVWSIEEACEAKLLDKDKLSDLTLAWSSLHSDPYVDAKALLAELVPPRHLNRLCLEHYSGESFPGWFMDVFHHLPNLVTIILDSLPNCNNLPPLGQLPNLEVLSLISCDRVTKIGKDFCGGKGAFRRLVMFTLCKLKELEELCTTYSFEDGVEEFMFPVLDTLEIESCPMLRLKPCPPICRALIVIQSDGIISSLEALGNNNGYLTSSTKATLLRIVISNSQSLNLFHHFTTIKELELFDCSQLTGLPESMRHLKCLESLKLQYCPSISALPEWLRDFSSLKSLTIEDCKELRLWIKSGAELKRWWELKGNMKKSSLTSTT